MCVYVCVGAGGRGGEVSESFRLGSTWTLERVEHLERGWKHIPSPCNLPCVSLPSSCPELQSFTINQWSNKWNVSLSSVTTLANSLNPKRGLGVMQETLVEPLGWEDPLGKGMTTLSSILAGKSHGQRSLAGYSPRGRKESNMYETNTQVTTWTVIVILSGKGSLQPPICSV